MWGLKLRSARKTATVSAPAAGVSAVFDEEFDGDLEQLRAEIERLTESGNGAADRETQRRLLRLEHLAGIRLVDDAPEDPVFVAPEADRLPAGDPLPEVGASEVSAALIRAGILRDGCLLVRGLVPREQALAMAERINRAFEARSRRASGQRGAEPDYYEEFAPHPRYGAVAGRGWIEQGGGLLAADSPLPNREMMQLFRSAGLGPMVSEYLGEPALISVHKTTMRKAEPSVPGAWHQDGFFMGDVRSLNMWLSLSRCGDVAPGLDLLPTRLDRYLATNTDGSPLDYTISQHKVQEAAGATPILRPIFEPGDALFFDELFLHQTGSDPAMQKPRYAIENWFFGGSAFPAEYAPMAV